MLQYYEKHGLWIAPFWRKRISGQVSIIICTRSRPNKNSLLELVTKFTCNVIIIIIYVSNTDNHKRNLKYDEIQNEDLTPPPSTIVSGTLPNGNYFNSTRVARWGTQVLRYNKLYVVKRYKLTVECALLTSCSS